MQQNLLRIQIFKPGLIRDWTAAMHTSIPSYTKPTEEMRGLKFDQAMDIPNMLTNQREVDGELEGFKSRFYHVDPNDPEQSARVLSYFKSRQPPPTEKKMSFRDALKKPREVFKKTREQVSSFMKSRPGRVKMDEKETVPPKVTKGQPYSKEQK
ncbi:uncharacterized protein [Halyomorpha halys]|uniref:uncharacterized protein n=1 Tax=Halyomorpha halys TaxID=286706 RepID=UPI0006D5096F|nr:uncharacterized protein LOC106687817 [Halyomorpha halys]